METYQREFIEFMVRSGVLRFGDFMTKSGRRTPFFINTGLYDTGEKVARLGRFYAAAIRAHLADGDYDSLFGPAYKGIPLVVATAIALADHHGRSVPFAFNRKEAKDHGEGGSLIGHKPSDGERILIVEDVTTAGTSVRETAALLGSVARVRLAGLVVSVDRQERGTGRRGALAELRAEFGLRDFSIVTLDDVVAHLHNRPIDGGVVLDDAMRGAIEAYRAQYGACDE
ncbi:MAG: orotate phosphoribosyltransferase [bacterium]|nr:orotate phosphoribosyltransferase [bacterium]